MLFKQQFLLSNKKVIGTVVNINKENPKTKLHSMDIEFDNKDGNIKPGMIVNVKIFDGNTNKAKYV